MTGRKKKKQEPEAELSRAEANIKWCEDWLYIPEGKNVGHRLEMAQFMKDDFIAIYDNEAITRRAILSRSRKNAKTFEAACILLLHLCGIEAAHPAQQPDFLHGSVARSGGAGVQPCRQDGADEFAFIPPHHGARDRQDAGLPQAGHHVPGTVGRRGHQLRPVACGGDPRRTGASARPAFGVV